LIQVSSLECIQKLIGKIKNHKKSYLTNFFLDIPKLKLWIKLSLIEFEENVETVIICKSNQGFKNLYFISTSLEVLKNDIYSFLTIHKDELYVIDIIAKGTDGSGLKDVFTNIGFYQYTSLVRMSQVINKSSKKPFYETYIYVADKVKGLEVHRLLQMNFDAFAEQLPLLEEIDEWVKKKEIIIYSDDAKTIQGFLIFDLTGQTSYLRYWFVHSDYRDKKIGSKLLNYFFEESGGTIRRIFWVIESNENAIKRYEHYGFRKEELYDYVMINKNIFYER
jgi:ribosomal protein S18 acetylase RimI-like enzyme